MNIAEWLYARERLDADKPALFSGSVPYLDYRGFAEASRRLADVMRTRLGIREGDRVALYMRNCPDYLTCMFGVLWAGAVIVPVNYKLHAREFDWIVENSAAAVAIVDVDPASLELSRHECRVVSLFDLLGLLPEAVPSADLQRPISRKPEDLAWLFYTSGTTGRPKGVMLTHQNLVSMSLCYPIDVDDLVPDEAVIYAAPMSHGAGLYAFIHVRNASRHVVPASQGFDPPELFDMASQLRQVSLFAAPTMVKRLVAHAKAQGQYGDGIKTIICGGAPMYAADLIEALDTLGPRFALIYGQGESPMTITALHRRLVSNRDHPDWSRRITTVGLPHSCVAVQVTNDVLKPLEPGMPGEVVVRGTTVMAGYWRNETASAKTLVDGWLHTGDIGFLSEDGFLTLTDRSKDVIISGGSNIYPREVEEVLVQHPSIYEASVVGAPDPEWGEQVVAFIRLHESASVTQQELDDWCRSQIAAFKRPKRYVFCAELPKNSYGKVLKTELRARLQEGSKA